MVTAVIEAAREHFEELRTSSRSAAQEKKLVFEAEIYAGPPTEPLVLAAERHHAALIVMGRRGKSTFRRWMFGSISESVLRYAHCSVLVVH